MTAQGKYFILYRKKGRLLYRFLVRNENALSQATSVEERAGHGIDGETHMETSYRWLTERTFHHRQFSDLRDLVRRKKEQGLRLSLCIPTLNEAETIGQVVTSLLPLCRGDGLIDELVVVDSGSTDQTQARAAAAGAVVYQAADILPETGHVQGKGENLWKALYQLTGDILIFLDGDVVNMHPCFVTGLVGPLLHDPDLGYVKAFYDRPVDCGDQDGEKTGGRVTEILVRPMLSRLVPELTAVIQPLSGEYAARRSILESLPFPQGYGVELAHLLDLHAAHGLDVLAQTDVGERRHRRRSNLEMGRMAFSLVQVLERRIPWPNTVSAEPPMLRQFVRRDGCFRQSIWTHREQERPPMLTLAAYCRRHGRPLPTGESQVEGNEEE
ncbi:MAG: glucosyl-3-phosphoglycerate synthase [Desulfobulbus sp.]|jgi:glucosyl-3-phosphoglycerate synthase